MPTVDSKGRIVLPKDVRESHDLTPGTEVEVHDEDGRLVLAPGPDPEEILENLEVLTAKAAAERGPTRPLDADPYARDHRETIREGAARSTDATDE